MMNKTDLCVIGGFLGAGKTTSILGIAKHLVSMGKKVGIVTNDQGSDLVDTNFLIKSGLPVLEVTGGCFCCNFDEFTKKVNELSESLMPDIVLAEPAGSCTDLIATIFKPLKLNYTKQFSLAPLSIVVDPKRVKKLMMEKYSPFPSEINYLFQKQLEEADILALNKTDKLSENEAEEIISFLKDRFKGIDVIPICAKDQKGIEEWISLIYNFEPKDKSSLKIDYKTYAEAEAMLGWLNSSGHVKSPVPHDANAFISSLMDNIKDRLKKENMEIAHLKVYEIGGEDWAKASLTSIFDEIDFNKKMERAIKEGNLIINARINISPETLEPIVMEALKHTASEYDIAIEGYEVQCFKPGKPKPKYRME